MPTITQTYFGQTPEGEATLFTLTNTKGNSIKVTDFGGIITSIVVDGEEMVVGFDELGPYLSSTPYYGALIGRYGNRIANGKFSLNGETFTLPRKQQGATSSTVAQKALTNTYGSATKRDDSGSSGGNTLSPEP